MEGFKKFLFHYKKGDVIYREGDEQGDFFIINKGRVQLKLEKHDMILMPLLKGDFFGEESFNGEQPAAYTVEVMEESDIIKIPYPSLTEMMKQSADIALKILKKLSEKNIRTLENLLTIQATAKPKKKKAEETEDSRDDTQAETLSPDIKAYLVIQRSNRIVQLTKKHTFLGRRDYTTGFIPDIDLTKEDEEKYISRKHAQISFTDNKFYVSEETGAINGTFLNGEKLKTGVKYDLKNEDELTLCHLNIIFKY
jgi:CRP-like cAMP-binding protein